ncbi:MAG: amino acid racemase, partial [Pseudomonadota bacterium]
NTMHKCAPAIETATDLPFPHIGDATAEALLTDNRQRPLLLGTSFTMEEAFYTDRLKARRLEPVIPNAKQRADINRIIFEELVHGIICPESQRQYIDIVRSYSVQTDSVILGCTEIGMLLNADNAPLPPYDTAHLHCDTLIDKAVP